MHLKRLLAGMALLFGLMGCAWAEHLVPRSGVQPTSGEYSATASLPIPASAAAQTSGTSAAQTSPNRTRASGTSAAPAPTLASGQAPGIAPTAPVFTALPATDTPIPTPTSTPLPTLAFDASGPAACLSGVYPPQAGRVVNVLSGDTIVVETDGRSETVRYLGVSAPVQADGSEWTPATRLNSALVMGQEVLLFRDVSERDNLGRLLRYVLVVVEPVVVEREDHRTSSQTVFVNYELARLGYLYAYRLPPDTACSQVLLDAQQAAASGESGTWKSTPLPTRTPILILAWQLTATALGPFPTLYPTVTPEVCLLAYPEVCIPPRPPNLDCKDIFFRDFVVWPPDPHHFDYNNNGIGCDKQDLFIEGGCKERPNCPP